MICQIVKEIHRIVIGVLVYHFPLESHIWDIQTLDIIGF